MVKLLTNHPGIDLDLKNSIGNTCFEAHADGYGFDEAANYVENKFRFRNDTATGKDASRMFFKPIDADGSHEK